MSKFELSHRPKSDRFPGWPQRWPIHLLLCLSCLLVGIPLLYAMLVSTQSNPEVIAFQVTPGSSLGRNIWVAMVSRNLGRYMLNSTIQAVIVTVGKTILSLLAGLAFVYFRFPGKWLVFGFVLLTLMMPTELLTISLFRIVAGGFQWGDSLYALTVPFLASATGAFLFRQHFANLPAELSEAAQLDGAGPLIFLWRILLPLSWNAIGALAVIQFVYVWNMYLWPVLIIRSDRLQVVQVGLSSIQSAGDTGTAYGPLMAGAILASLPPLLVFILLQKQFMSGFQISREK
ncbi:MAG: carbohydrate ABC transporter permease [Leptolyngbya sp. DLM2.Bin15]|nr:MAG: carbohydrate ABC transporter permease [Leptolyngbya sp. DLM2.Bin15]